MGIRDGLEVVKNIGICNEKLHKYNQSFKNKPGIEAYEDAFENKICSYFRINVGIQDFKEILSIHGPIIFGIRVTKSFLNCEDGNVKYNASEEVIGLHSILCCGYNESMKAIKIQNSWGTKWGLDGYAWMSYDYLLSQGSNAYILVTGPGPEAKYSEIHSGKYSLCIQKVHKYLRHKASHIQEFYGKIRKPF